MDPKHIFVILISIFLSVELVSAQKPEKAIEIRKVTENILRDDLPNAKVQFASVDSIATKWFRIEQPADWYFCAAFCSDFDEEDPEKVLGLTHLAMRHLISSTQNQQILPKLKEKMELKLQSLLYDVTRELLANSSIPDVQEHEYKYFIFKSKNKSDEKPSNQLKSSRSNKSVSAETILIAKNEDEPFRFNLTRILSNDMTSDTGKEFWKDMGFEEIEEGVVLKVLNNETTIEKLNEKSPYLVSLIEQYLIQDKMVVDSIEIQAEFQSSEYNDSYIEKKYEGKEVIYKQSFKLNNSQKYLTLPSKAKMKNSDLILLKLMKVGSLFRLSCEDALKIPEPAYFINIENTNPDKFIKIIFTLKPK